MKTGKFGILVFSLLLMATVFGPASNKAASDAADNTFVLADITRQKFTGNFDAMVQRRLIRVLVAYSKTGYFEQPLETA